MILIGKEHIDPSVFFQSADVTLDYTDIHWSYSNPNVIRQSDKTSSVYILRTNGISCGKWSLKLHRSTCLRTDWFDTDQIWASTADSYVVHHQLSSK